VSTSEHSVIKESSITVNKTTTKLKRDSILHKQVISQPRHELCMTAYIARWRDCVCSYHSDHCSLPVVVYLVSRGD